MKVQSVSQLESILAVWLSESPWQRTAWAGAGVGGLLSMFTISNDTQAIRDVKNDSSSFSSMSTWDALKAWIEPTAVPAIAGMLFGTVGSVLLRRGLRSMLSYPRGLSALGSHQPSVLSTSNSLRVLSALGPHQRYKSNEIPHYARWSHAYTGHAQSGGAAVLSTTKGMHEKGSTYLEDAFAAFERVDADGAMASLRVGADGISGVRWHHDEVPSRSAHAVIDGVTETWMKGSLSNDQALEASLSSNYARQLSGLISKQPQKSVQGGAQLVAIEGRVVPFVSSDGTRGKAISLSALSAGDATAFVMHVPKQVEAIPNDKTSLTAYQFWNAVSSEQSAPCSDSFTNPVRMECVTARLALPETEASGYLISVLHSDGLSKCMLPCELLARLEAGVRAQQTPEALVREISDVVRARVDEVFTFRNTFLLAYNGIVASDHPEKNRQAQACCDRYLASLKTRMDACGEDAFLQQRYRLWHNALEDYTQKIMRGEAVDPLIEQDAFYSFASPDDCFLLIDVYPISSAPTIT